MRYAIPVVGALAAAGIAGWAMVGTGTAPSDSARPAEGAALAQVKVPTDLSGKAQMGRIAFEAKCAACHGDNAAGRNGLGPPLVHKIYEPSHHGDESFQLAVARGVTAHHWRFGDMPPQDGLTRADVDTIIAYVRELQRANGID